MKTTIVVEDEGPAAAPPGARQEFAATSATDAGPAPTGGDGRATPSAGARGAGGIDGGVPPGWLIDAIAAAGGMASPASPEGIELLGWDAGAAPGR